MIFANASSDAVLKADPYVEIGIAALCFLTSGLQVLDFYLQHHKTGTTWSRKQLQQVLIPLGVGIMFVFFYFLPHN